MTEIDIPTAMEKAAEIILSEGGFGKGRFKIAEGCYCTLGAFAVGLGARADFRPGDGITGVLIDAGAYEAFLDGWEHLNETVRPLVVQQMNDDPATTADQMAGVLRETAARLRGAGA